ncbi:MAG: 8-oxo-(d)GTP phosphatase [Micromonosporaceae bacterium]|nr:8-oxo-(d)GTP phosphatase [Micromonosporaceae bacterium]
MVRAAGGVVGRAGPDGPEVVLVHRPRYDDWSLPKGKLDPGEHPLIAAIREVREETGVYAVPRLRLPTTRYLTGDPDIEKLVDYWAMDARRVIELPPGDEVDEVRWVPVARAGALLTYAHDRGVLAAYPRLCRVNRLVVLLRHAYAGERSAWPGADADRPLAGTGPATAAALAPLLAAYEPTRIISAGPVRCVQTVRPLAELVRLPIEVDNRFAESAGAPADTDIIRDLANHVAVSPNGWDRAKSGGECDPGGVGDPAGPGDGGARGGGDSSADDDGRDGVTVVCSQGGIIPDVVGTLSGRDRQAYRTPKGSAWILGFAGADFVGADRFDP